jgi:hypothetical protein
LKEFFASLVQNELGQEYDLRIGECVVIPNIAPKLFGVLVCCKKLNVSDMLLVDLD